MARAKKTKTPKEPKLNGRPTKCTPELGALIGSLLAEGQSLRKILATENMPHMSTIMDWLAKGYSKDAKEPYRSFAEHYARGREAQAEVFADEIVDISDDSTQDEIFTDEGKRVCNVEFVQRSKLRIDARKWVASKLLPKKYGEKVQTEVVGKDSGAIEITDAKATLLRGLVQNAPAGGADTPDQ
jgi:hypothetical protein